MNKIIEYIEKDPRFRSEYLNVLYLMDNFFSNIFYECFKLTTKSSRRLYAKKIKEILNKKNIQLKKRLKKKQSLDLFGNQHTNSFLKKCFKHENQKKEFNKKFNYHYLLSFSIIDEYLENQNNKNNKNNEFKRFHKAIEQLRQKRNNLEHPEERKDINEKNIFLYIFLFLPSRFSHLFLARIKHYCNLHKKKDNRFKYESEFSSLEKDCKKINKKKNQYISEQSKFLKIEKRKNDKNNQTKEERREAAKKLKQLKILRDFIRGQRKISKSKDETAQWKEDYNKYKEISRTYTFLNFKQIYNFIGKKNINLIEEEFKKQGYKNTNFLVIEKFYLSLFEINLVLKKYVDIIFLNIKKHLKNANCKYSQKEIEDIKCIRNHIAHSNIFGINNEIKAKTVFEKNEIKAKTVFEKIIKYLNKNLENEFILEIGNTFKRAKLPIVDNKIIRKLNYKKIKKAENKTNCYAIEKIVKTWVKDLFNAKKSIKN